VNGTCGTLARAALEARKKRSELLRDVLYRIILSSALRRLHARAAEFVAQGEGASDVHVSEHFEEQVFAARPFGRPCRAQ
jgi:hypothetical protein